MSATKFGEAYQSQPWWGDLAELIVYERELTALERKTVEDHLLAKYGVLNTVTTPSISPAGGVFTGSVTVSIETQTPGAEIHYTLDGTEPTLGSPVYADPLLIDATVTLKAKAFEGCAGSERDGGGGVHAGGRRGSGERGGSAAVVARGRGSSERGGGPLGGPVGPGQPRSTDERVGGSATGAGRGERPSGDAVRRWGHGALHGRPDDDPDGVLGGLGVGGRDFGDRGACWATTPTRGGSTAGAGRRA